MGLGKGLIGVWRSSDQARRSSEEKNLSRQGNRSTSFSFINEFSNYLSLQRIPRRSSSQWSWSKQLNNIILVQLFTLQEMLSNLRIWKSMAKLRKSATLTNFFNFYLVATECRNRSSHSTKQEHSEASYSTHDQLARHVADPKIRPSRVPANHRGCLQKASQRERSLKCGRVGRRGLMPNARRLHLNLVCTVISAES